MAFLACKRLFCALGVCALLAAGCGEGGEDAFGATDYMDDQPPSGSCLTSGGTGCTAGSSGSSGTAGGTTGTTGGDADACGASTECPAGQVCVADFDGKTRAPFACVPAGSGCVPPSSDPLADGLWCADDLACCDPNTRCTKRGLCEPDGPGTGTGTGTGG